MKSIHFSCKCQTPVSLTLMWIYTIDFTLLVNAVISQQIDCTLKLSLENSESSEKLTALKLHQGFITILSFHLLAALKLRFFMLHLRQWHFLKSQWESPIIGFHAKQSHTPKQKWSRSPGTLWLGRTLPQLPDGSCGLPRGTGGQKVFSAELWISVTSPLFSRMTVLKPRNSHFPLFPKPPLENKIIHTATMNELCHCRNSSQASEIRKWENWSSSFNFN